jgi:hypothetical protein
MRPLTTEHLPVEPVDIPTIVNVCVDWGLNQTPFCKQLDYCP